MPPLVLCWPFQPRSGSAVRHTSSPQRLNALKIHAVDELPRKGPDTGRWRPSRLGVKTLGRKVEGTVVCAHGVAGGALVAAAMPRWDRASGCPRRCHGPAARDGPPKHRRRPAPNWCQMADRFPEATNSTRPREAVTAVEAVPHDVICASGGRPTETVTVWAAQSGPEPRKSGGQGRLQVIMGWRTARRSNSRWGPECHPASRRSRGSSRGSTCARRR